jgi:hypothetical protein
MFRFMALLHMRGFSKSRTEKMDCKLTNGGPPVNDCASSCVSKCQIMETRDEVDAFIANAKCNARCAHTNAVPKPGDCSCTHVCIADMSELYCIMTKNCITSK